jgi:hypothetical protein
MTQLKKIFVIAIITIMAIITILGIIITLPYTPPIIQEQEQEPLNFGQNPLALDNDGYYIADIHELNNQLNIIANAYQWPINPNQWDAQSASELKSYITKSATNFAQEYKPFNQYTSTITLENNIISSGGTLNLTGTSNIESFNDIPILIINKNTKPPFIQKDQAFSAPSLPTDNIMKRHDKKVNNDIKIKIPALNIHLNPELITQPLKNGTTINGSVLITTHKFDFTIIYDTNHPMIIEDTQTINSENTTTTWAWTSEPSHTHTWTNHNNNTKIFTQGYILNPYPTAPKPTQSW